MRQIVYAIIIALFSTSCMAQNTNNTPVANLNLERYLGSWYEIARMDHSFERGITQAQANYSLKDNGTVLVINSGMKNNKFKTSKGKAKLTNKQGILKVSFFGPFYSEYRVLMLDNNYRYALVGSKSDKFLWILSRTPVMDESDLNRVLKEARSRGYDTDKLIWVDQKCM